MAFSAYPKFLLSKYYVAPCLGSSETEESRIADTVKGNRGEAKSMTVENSIQTKMSIELDKMLAGTSWLSGLLSSIESLPVCVSLAAASRTMRGFPLVYVNAAFETTTGYDRSEILGQVRRWITILASCLQFDRSTSRLCCMRTAITVTPHSIYAPITVASHASLTLQTPKSYSTLLSLSPLSTSLSHSALLLHAPFSFF